MTSCSGLKFYFKNQTLLLLPEKAILWLEAKTLIAADVHLGKVGHFRKAGIAIPQILAQDDLAVLSDLIREHHPEQIIFLGDLFHSDLNADWDWFALWRHQFPKLKIQLIRGNHDIIPERNYEQIDITVYDELVVGPFRMLHHPLKTFSSESNESYVLCGHIHPGVLLKGKGNQSLVLPCFAFGDYQCILPSFGKFTGKVALRHQQNHHVFGILKDKVIAL